MSSEPGRDARDRPPSFCRAALCQQQASHFTPTEVAPQPPPPKPLPQSGESDRKGTRRSTEVWDGMDGLDRPESTHVDFVSPDFPSECVTVGHIRTLAHRHTFKCENPTLQFTVPVSYVPDCLSTELIVNRLWKLTVSPEHWMSHRRPNNELFLCLASVGKQVGERQESKGGD